MDCFAKVLGDEVGGEGDYQGFFDGGEGLGGSRKRFVMTCISDYYVFLRVGVSLG